MRYTNCMAALLIRPCKVTQTYNIIILESFIVFNKSSGSTRSKEHHKLSMHKDNLMAYTVLAHTTNRTTNLKGVCSPAMSKGGDPCQH